MGQRDRYMVYRGNRGYGKRVFVQNRIRQIDARIAYLKGLRDCGIRGNLAEIEYYQGERRALLQWLEATEK